MIFPDIDRPWPLLICSGDRYTAALMNRKAFLKSRENGSPWIVHPSTGRVLPWPKSPEILTLKEEKGCYFLEIPQDSMLNPYGSESPPDLNPDNRDNMKGMNEKSAIESGILNRLAEIVAERHKMMPEASYTSHLFQSGPEKIRKKVGEEAVELLLAQSEDDIIYESADLLYHIQVLLEALNIDWSDVEKELERRLSS